MVSNFRKLNWLFEILIRNVKILIKIFFQISHEIYFKTVSKERVNKLFNDEIRRHIIGKENH